MDQAKLSKIAMENIRCMSYMSDIDTFEMLYVNEEGKRLLGIKDESEILQKKCYELLQDKQEPCEFCNNMFLKKDEQFTWQRYNSVMKRECYMTATRINIDGRNVRLEVAVDVSSHKQEMEKLENKLTNEEVILRCIRTLRDHDDMDEAIDDLLSIIGKYYDADRTYIFEFDYTLNEMTNTNQWCNEHIEPQRDIVDRMPIEKMALWIERFKNEGAFRVCDDEVNLEKNDYTKNIMQLRKISRLLVSPLIHKGKVIGFLGADNPRNNFENIELLNSVGIFALDDIQKRRMYNQLEYMSYTDALTGMYNRNKYIDRLRELEQSPPTSLGVVYVDINGLKQANDTYGHVYGDQIIVKVASLLKGILGKEIYRAGGDEFISFMINKSESEFNKTVNELRERTEEEEGCSVSIGSIWKQGKVDAAKEIMKSDDLMYAEKQSYYKTMLGSRMNNRSSFARQLIEEIEAGRFTVHLQAKVELATGLINGAEALVRKVDKDGNFIPPDKFISMYEFDRIIRHVDFFVLETVCKMLREWIDNEHPLPISINFSRVSFMEHNIADQILEICNKYDVPPKWINVEITETSDKMDVDVLRRKIIDVKEKGFAVSLDDFGAQYSNLLMLTNMEFSEVKIDKSLVDMLCDNHNNKVVMEHTLKMVQELKSATSLAEGVETKEQMDMLKSFNCDSGQGYFFLKPLPIAEFLEVYLAQRQGEES